MGKHLRKDLVFLILQFLDEEDLKEAAHELERRARIYFNMKYFEDMILSGDWDGAERYLSGFTKLDDNKFSTKIYFEIRKLKFLEALDKNDRAMALDILMKDLKVFASENQELFKELTQLLTLNDIREHDSLTMYRDIHVERSNMMLELQKLIEANPCLLDKLEFPRIRSSRLRHLINQSLNWQHLLCTNPQPNPKMRTLFTDHVCIAPEDHDNIPPNSQTSVPVPTSSAYTTSTVYSATDSTTFCEASCSGGSKKLDATIRELEDNTIVHQNSSEASNEETSNANIGEAILNTPNNLPTATHSDQRSLNILGELAKSPSGKNMLGSCGEKNNVNLPKTVARILNEGSTPTTMDFHPIQQTVLLVGSNTGDIRLWEASTGEQLLSRSFKVWNIGASSSLLKTSLLKDPSVSVNRVAWSPEGSLFGIAYSKHIVHIYSYHSGNDAQQQLEIDAHIGGVNDLAFATPKKEGLVITCGDDKTIKAFDVTTGVKKYNFEGHDAPVYSLYPHIKAQIHFFFSTSVDGNIKAWLYEEMGARVDYNAPGLGCTSMAYSADDRRLFSCGTSSGGESFLVEWDESEGTIKRTYQGLKKNSSSVVQFDIMKNQVLAAGDDHLIKIWDMNEVELLTTIDADGGLPENPHIRFNKDGTLLAVFANENRIKILATDDGLQMMPKSESTAVDALGTLSSTFGKNGDPKNLEAMNKSFREDASTSGGSKHFEIIRPSQCQALWLPSPTITNKISRLTFNNAGNAILALASNAVHLLWKWKIHGLNGSHKATTEVSPQLWQPRNSLGFMTNDLSGTNPEKSVPCFALSKNDCYLMSASGGKISLFNMMTFQSLLSFMPPPPATTCLAFHPRDNNIIAIGRDDSIIMIYNVRSEKVISELMGHSGRVSSLAFSNALNVLVSFTADAEISTWNTKGWRKQGRKYLQTAYGTRPAPLSETRIQFHNDQIHFLAVHATQLALYEAMTLDCVKQWMPGDSTPISSATFSCDSHMVYASFVDGTVSIFDATHLELRCRIVSTAYLPPSPRDNVYPVDIAAHPQKPSQFAVGLTNGAVIVFEPLDPDCTWSALPPEEDAAASNTASDSDI